MTQLSLNTGGNSEINYAPGDVVHTGDYFTYEVIEDKGTSVVVQPAYGYSLQWGETQEEQYFFAKSSLHPGSGGEY